jgi:hypothetical protein
MRALRQRLRHRPGHRPDHGLGLAGQHGYLTLRGANPGVLVVLDTLAPTSRLALLDATSHLAGDFAVLSPAPLPNGWPGTRMEPAATRVPDELSSVRVVASTGHYLPLGAVGYGWSRELGADYVTVQHGLLTTFAPPLAPDSWLLAWSDQDAAYWSAGRDDVQVAVAGSQLLWEAGREAAGSLTDTRPTFLGQLHSAEIGRWPMARFTGSFCRREGLRYRPHPGEKDRLSRWQHAVWRLRGIDFDDGRVPLRELPTPVVSVFSTGILEAAARGVPAWAAYDDPPAWLAEFWERYAMARYGTTPTPAPVRPATEPAAAVAAALESR